MRKRIFSVMLCVCLALTMLPVSALAETGTSTDGGLIINGTDSGYAYNSSTAVLNIDGNGTYTIGSVGTSEDTIFVSSDGTVNIILNGINIDASSNPNPAFSIATGATVNLTLVGENVLSSGGYFVAGLQVPNGATLNITADSTGTLTATGGDSSAGIGGADRIQSGTVNIHGGSVTAIGGNSGAGIGGGYYGDGGTVNITGGIVTATGENGSAGIGGGSMSGSGGTVNISGGIVTATGGSYGGAGIGGGKRAMDYGGNGGSVTITGGNVKAIAGSGAEAIGHGSGATESGTLTGVGGVTLNRAPSIVTLDGVGSADVTVGDLTFSGGYTYPDMTTMAGGELCLWLPDSTAVTGATVDGTQYCGGVTSGSTGTLGVAAASVTTSGDTPQATKYADFAVALTAAQTNSGSTLTLLGDVTSGSDIHISNPMTLDLNGHTLDMGSTTRLDLGGQVIGNTLYVNAAGGDLTVNDSSSDKSGILTSSGTSLRIRGKAVVNDGTIQTTGAANYAFWCELNPDVTINGGTFIGTRVDAAFTSGKLTINGGNFTSEGLQADSAGVTLKGGTFSRIQAPDSTTANSLLTDGFKYYSGSNTSGAMVDGSSRSIYQPVTVGELDWSKAVTYDNGTNTYTVLSADGLRWISGVSNGTITADTYQNDPQMPAKSSERGYFSGATVKLNTDIDLSGENWTPIQWFGGIFDGAGHSITGLKVDGVYDQSGFFAALSGEARNLFVSGSVNVSSSNDIYAGGIAGIVTEYGYIRNCASGVAVTATPTASNAVYAGGLVGSNVGIIQNCILNGVTSGAFAGRAVSYCSIKNCYTPAGTNLVGTDIDSHTSYSSVGTYDASGNLTATNGTTLDYGMTLANAMKYWVGRQGEDAGNYVTWTTDAIPAMTSTYAIDSAASYGNWVKQADGGYIRTDENTGLTQTAEVAVTPSGGTETPYATLVEAITAAQSASGSTVKLLTDVTTEAEVDVASGTFTIDLNGKTWMSTVTSSNALSLTGDADVTLMDSGTDGKFTSASANGCATVKVSSASATIKSGTYASTGSYGCALTICDVKNEGDQVTITGGTYQGDVAFYSCKNVSISGGMYTAMRVQTDDINCLHTFGGLLADGYAYRSTESGNAWINSEPIGDLTSITVQTAPVQITKQPQGATVTYGYNGAPALSVAVQEAESAVGDISYQWYSVGTGAGGVNEAISDNAASESYTVPTGLAVGDYSYYCTVGCDGYTVSSATVTVTVNKVFGSVVNKDYATSCTYNGSAIAVPTAENFTANGGTDFAFTWYSGQNEDGSVNGLTVRNDAPTNSGTYTLKVDVAETTNVSAASVTVPVTIGTAVPSIGDVTYTGGTLYTSTDPSLVTLTRADTLVPGILALDGVGTLTEGTQDYNWKFTPTDADNYNAVRGIISLIVSADTLQGISVADTPNKTSYTYGDTFDTTGLTVIATYASGKTKDVTASVTVNALAVGDTSETLSYTEDGVTKTCAVSGITVAKAAAPAVSEQAKSHIRTVATTGNTINLAVLLPADRGTTTYKETGSYSGIENVSVSTDGTLTYNTKVSDSALTDTIIVKTVMQNYADTTIIVKVSLTDRTGVTITGLSAPTNRVYNGSAITDSDFGTPAFTPDTYTGAGLTYTYYSGSTAGDSPLSGAPKDAGTYTVRVTIPDTDTDYEGHADVTFTIGKATVTATADSKSMTRGNTLPTFTVSYTGLASGDTAAIIFATQATAVTTADGKTAGNYVITVTTPVLTTDAQKNYTVGTPVSGTLTVSNASSGSSSSGGSSSGTAVPVSSDAGKTSLTASVSGSTAAISATASQIAAIASSAKEIGAVTVDVSSLKVNAATIPSKVVSAVQKAEGFEGLAVAMPTGTVTLDQTALAAVEGKGDVKFSVETVDNSKLTDTQKAMLGSQAETALVVDVNVYTGNSRISTFGNGTITVSVPYTLKSGERADSITVWFVNDDGTIEPKTASYVNGKVTFTTEHLSQYLIIDFPFADVAESAWCYGSVAYAYDNGLFSGTSATTFSPNAAMTRQMIWMVLARLDGKTPASMDEAKTWAVENKISDGTNPANSVTREQLAAILYRYAQYKGYNTTQGGMMIREFSDYDSISAYAQPALGWAVNAGLVQGNDNQIMPSGTASRAQVATILMRFCKNVMK